MKLSYRNQRNAEIIARYWNKPLDKPDWFEIKAEKDDVVEIFIYDVIGWPFIDAQEFVTALSGINGKDILIRINSPGGDIFDALAMFNAIGEYKGKLTIRIESLAASSASIIAIAGKEVQAYKNTMMMIHEPWAIAIGNQYDFREMMEILGKISGNIIDTYADNSNIGKRDIKSMMKDETWFTAKEMKEKGLIDTILDGDGVKAKFDLSMFSKTPETLQGQREGREFTIREIEAALRDAGASRAFAKAVAAGCSQKPEPVKEGPEEEDASLRDAAFAALKTLTIDMYGGYKQ